MGRKATWAIIIGGGHGGGRHTETAQDFFNGDDDDGDDGGAVCVIFLHTDAAKAADAAIDHWNAVAGQSLDNSTNLKFDYQDARAARGAQKCQRCQSQQASRSSQKQPEDTLNRAYLCAVACHSYLSRPLWYGRLPRTDHWLAVRPSIRPSSAQALLAYPSIFNRPAMSFNMTRITA